ncbi:MAG: hypothetical protein ACTSPD_12020 [Promethearchaeota archaeon]
MSRHISIKHPKEFPQWKLKKEQKLWEEKEKKRQAREKLREEQKKHMNDWEKNFIISIIEQLNTGKSLTNKQSYSLNRILNKEKIPEKIREDVEIALTNQKVIELRIMSENCKKHINENISILPKWGDDFINQETNAAFSPNIGPISIPQDWVFVPSGNTARTRAIKREKQWWITLKAVYFRKERHWQPSGLLCPESTMEKVIEYLNKTKEKRKKAREYRRKTLERKLAEEGITYHDAVINFLNFSEENQEEAEEFFRTLCNYSHIIDEFPVLPNTKKGQNLLNQVESEIINHARHQCTLYEDYLYDLNSKGFSNDEIGFWLKKEDYWYIRARANQEAWEWIEDNRKTSRKNEK